MDSQKFGAFISELRKERGWTQLELAQKLNVTDKAVSKWERGAGFPDIKLIEPLADALGVSVLEIMKSEKIYEPKIPTENANETMSQIIDIAILQKKIEKRNLAIGIICAALAVAIVFFAGSYGWYRLFYGLSPGICCCYGDSAWHYGNL